MIDYPKLPCPECGSNVEIIEDYEGAGYLYTCTGCGWGESNSQIENYRETEEAAHLAACEVINRSRMIPVDEALPRTKDERVVRLEGGRVVVGAWYNAEMREWHTTVGLHNIIATIAVIGWWLRPDESADLKESGVKPG